MRQEMIRLSQGVFGWLVQQSTGLGALGFAVSLYVMGVSLPPLLAAHSVLWTAAGISR